MPRRPASVTTIAVLNIVFGSLGLLCSLIGAAITAVQMSGANFGPPNANAGNIQAALMAELNKELPGYTAITIGLSVATAVICLLMLVGGIGQLGLKPWGRSVGNATAVLLILLIIAFVPEVSLFVPRLAGLVP